MPFLLAIIGGPALILAYLFGGSAPPERPRSPVSQVHTPQEPSSSFVSSPGVTTGYVSLATSEVAAPVAGPAGKTQYVAGRTATLHAEPTAKAGILDRYEIGQAVETLEHRGGWVHVRHGLTQREGWIQAKRLRDEPPAAEAETQPKARPAPVAPALTAAAITKLLIARSIAEYPGPCACPYQSARNGSSCGKRAAYVRPGGYAPLCYPKDVTPEMIAAYRAES